MKYASLIAQMSLEEKASLMSGANFWQTKAIERLNIPSIMLTDGPHGLRKQGGKADHLGLHKSLPATCFPTAATLANSWDRELLYEVGRFIGLEASSQDVHVLLGPGLNIKRNPLCGRNFEYFSEDPFLSGVLATEMTKGIQSVGISACPKHYAVNSQEHMRMSIDEVVDERALHEIYLLAFEMVVQEAKPKTIMTSYNRVNGVYANENSHLLQDVLYGKWQYQGVVVTDWGGNNNRVCGLKMGNQLEMPSSNGVTDQEIIEAIQKGDLDERLLDEAVDSLLGLINGTQEREKKLIDYAEHHQKAIEVAKRSILLLKNDDNILPLQEENSIAIIGDFAKHPRYQGAGSSLVNPTQLASVWEILQQYQNLSSEYAQGFHRMGGKSSRLHDEAIRLAKRSDKILLFLGLDESSEAEGVDRKDLTLPTNQLLLLESLLTLQKDIIVIIAGGGVVEMPFVHNVKAIIHTYLAGQGGAEALVAILLGEYNPSAKLAESYPICYEDIPSSAYYPGLEAAAHHKESIFVGYRYFLSSNTELLFPFGFGLSYTTFTYRDLSIKDFEVTFFIKNSGSYFGEEIAQLYVIMEESQIFRARQELKGFCKVALQPEEEKMVRISLTERDFTFYDVDRASWQVEQGDYTIAIGASSTDLRLKKSLEFALKSYPSQEKIYPYYYQKRLKELPQEEFERLLGFKPTPLLWDRQKALGMNDTIRQAEYKHWLGRALYRFIYLFHWIFTKLRRPLLANNLFFLLNMQFQQISRFTKGKIPVGWVERFLQYINK